MAAVTAGIAAGGRVLGGPLLVARGAGGGPGRGLAAADQPGGGPPGGGAGGRAAGPAPGGVRRDGGLVTVAGCLAVAGAVLAVPLGLAALALWWNWLGTMGTGGALAQD